MRPAKEKPVQLTPQQTELVECIVGFLRYCDEKFEGEEDVSGLEGGGVLLGPPEAYYHPPKGRRKQR